MVVGALAGSLVHFALGSVLGLTGIALPALTDPDSGDLILDPQQAALFSSLLNIGAMVGSLASGPLMVWLGQRVTLLVALPVAAAGWFLLAFSPAVWVMQVSRVLLGVATGIFGGPSASYVAEITHSSKRGRLTGLTDLFRQFGFLFVYFIGSKGLSWRRVSLVCGCVTTLIPFVMLWFLPSSPRWLATKSRESDARQSLKWFRGDKVDIELEFYDIVTEQTHEKKGSNVRSQFMNFKDPSILKRLIFLALMLFAYQFTGNFSMIVFSATIFQSTQSNLDEYTCTIIVGCVRVIGVGVYIAMADKIGRRVLLLSSLVLSSVAITVVGLFLFLAQKKIVPSSLDAMPLVSLSVFIFFACIAEPTLILLRAELLPTSARSLGISVIYIFFYTGAFLVIYLYPVMVSCMGSHGVFWVYAAVGVAMAIAGAIFIPETRTKTLEHIEKSYREAEKVKLKVNEM